MKHWLFETTLGQTVLVLAALAGTVATAYGLLI
jgi:hypothetical protein